MLRIAVSQFRPTKGEYAQNVDRIAAVLAQAMALEVPPALVVFPETATSGYFVEGGVKDVAVTAGTLFRDLQTRYEQLGAPAVDVAVGFYELFQNHIFNSCLYASLGTASSGNASSSDASSRSASLGSASPGIRHVHRKIFLPTYGVFDEERFVDSGQDGVRAFDTSWGRAAILICEDAWHSLCGTIAALDGAQVILVPSASPARGTAADEDGTRLPASMVRWERVVRGGAEEHGVFVVLANLVGSGDRLALDCPLVHKWLVAFLKDEVVRRRGFTKGIVGVSGGVDSSLTAFLAAEALGKDNVIAVRMPYRTSSPESLVHAQLVIDKLGIRSLTLDISAAVDGYLAQIGDADGTRRGNVMARERMIVLFDLSAKEKALPIGTSNKSERLLGYFTWHADDTPPVNPLGDLFKTQVYALARHVGVPESILAKPPTPDLVPGQETERDYGFSYTQADPILYYLIRGYKPEDVVKRGFDAQLVAAVHQRLDSTHWKRRLPTVAMVSGTAIGEFYLRPVDY